MSPYIKIRNLSVLFRSYANRNPSLRDVFLNYFRSNDPPCHTTEALKHVDLEIHESDRVGVIGKNGAGKSTLMRCVAGIYPPSTGSLEIAGSVVPLLELGTGFDQAKSVRENVYLSAAILGIAKKDIEELLPEILTFSELGEFQNERLENLSSGMRSRLSFSVASAVSPDILLLDEVFAAGDASFVKKARARMLGMIDECHILLMVSHQEKIIREVCNKAIVFQQGQIVYSGCVDDAFKYYNEEIIR
jgi:lipopolysaccharide transport system ATP-binding protein